MDARRLGGTVGPQVSPLGFGAFKIGRNKGIRYAEGYELPTFAEVEALLHGALDLGINYIDTAPAYGVSEELIGAALAGRARDYVLSTKTGEEFDAEAVASTYDFSRDATWRSLERSLKRLRTDRLDAVFVHCSAADLAIARDEGVLDALCEAQAQRMVGLVGFSGRTEAGFRAALDRCQVLMVEYSKAVPELRPVLDLALERGVGVVVKKGLASGKLPAGEALKFALGHEAVSSVVVGSLSLHHLEENLAHAREALLGNQ